MLLRERMPHEATFTRDQTFNTLEYGDARVCARRALYCFNKAPKWNSMDKGRRRNGPIVTADTGCSPIGALDADAHEEAPCITGGLRLWTQGNSEGRIL